MADISASNNYIFNQYYFDLLKRCKDVAKMEKATSRDARNVLRAIKKHYRTYDMASLSYQEAWRADNGEAGARYLAADTEVSFDASLEVPWYTDITYDMIAKMQPNQFNQHQYWTLFSLLCRDDPIDGEAVVACLRVIGDAAAFDAAVAPMPDDVRAPLVRLRVVYDDVESKTKGPGGIDLSGIEDTSLGRLAKEILEDPAVQEIQESMKGSTSIADMFGGEGGGGIAKLMSTVSQKMMSKLANGELKQEHLLDDAMKFAGKLQGMMPGNLMGDLMGMAGGAAGGGGFDLSSLMSMMGGMNRQQKKRASSAAASASAGGSKRSHHRSGAAKAEALRKKLDAHRKKSETEVE
jgi:hypothetical protein